MPDNIEVVYRCKDEAERNRRLVRAEALLGTPWVMPPCPLHKVILHMRGEVIRAEGLGMIFNDACLMDTISGWGADGPLSKDTYNEDMEILYDHALELYKGIEVPEQLKNPNTPDGHPPPRNK